MGPSLMSGEWRDLAVLTWFAEPARLEPYLPADVELATWDGLGLISVVGLKFLHLRAVGVPVPGLQAFAQVNVRFYVQRRVDGAVRHGACFLLEMAPSRILRAGAHLTLHEPFVACGTRAEDVRMPLGRRRISYSWKGGDWQHLRVVIEPPPRMEAGPGSLETFILQRCWGYTSQPDGSTLEYRVEHPQWQVWPLKDVELDADWSGLPLPSGIPGLLARPPALALFATGSPMHMHMPKRLSAAGAHA